jgi:branched-chain amino acid transport system substrate-binding protein
MPLLNQRALTKVQGLIVIVCVIVAALIGVVAWQGLNPARSQKEILIGASLSLTGFMSAFGSEQMWAYQHAVDLVNKNGGIDIDGMGKLMVRLIVYDDKTDPNMVVTNIDRLVTVDKVDFLLGNINTPLVAAAAGEAEKLRVPLITGGTSSVAMRQTGYHYTFIAFESNDDEIKVFFEMLSKIPSNSRPKTIAVWAENTGTGADYRDLVPKMAPSYGFTVVLDETYPQGATDYTDLITKTQTLEPDVVMAIPLPIDGITLMRQSKQLSFSPKLFYMERAANGADFAQALGKDAEFVTADQAWRPDWDYPGNRELVEAYNATGQNVGEHTALGEWYSLAQILLEAIQSSRSIDKETVRKTLLTNTFSTVEGQIKFNENGIDNLNAVVFQWQGTTQVTVYSDNSPSTNLIYPAPAWSQRS